MKKSVSVVLLISFAVLLYGCAQGSSPAVNRVTVSDFSQNANISIGESSYDCLVEYIDGVVSVTAQSSSVNGLRFSYDGNELAFDYNDMPFSFQNVSADIVNPAVELYNVISVINSGGVTTALTDDGIIANGSTESGSFTALLNKDSSLCSVELKQTNIYIYFKALS